MKIFFDHGKNDVDFYERIGVKRPLIRFCLGKVFTNPTERYVVVFIALLKDTLWFRLGVRYVRVKELIEADCEQARLEERVKIVAWLRKEAQVAIDQSDFNESYCRANLLAASDIEAGEHLK